jgi:hypothetical protein
LKIFLQKPVAFALTCLGVEFSTWVENLFAIYIISAHSQETWVSCWILQTLT